MRMNPEAIEHQFLAVVNALDATLGNDGYYYGHVGGAPFLMKLTSVEPPTYLFRFRMTQPHDLPSDWVGAISEIDDRAQVECEIEGDYIFLWIRDSSSLDAEGISALARSCVSHHADFFPSAPGYCFDCGESGNASLIQVKSSISSICTACLELRARARELKEEKINESSGLLVVLIPIAVFVSAIGWAFFWWLYDAAFDAANVKYVWMPQIVIIAIVLGVGFGLGWPVGKLLHRSGLVKKIPPILLSIVVTLVTLSLGEFLFATYMVIRSVGVFDFGFIVQNMLPIAFGGDVIYALQKILFAATFGVAIFEIAKSKKIQITL